MITENELEEITSSMFIGITVGVGSLVLLFSSGARVLVQCTFQCGKEGKKEMGHGEKIMTSVLLFPFLNKKIKQANMLDGSILKLVLSDDEEICIIPENNGFESYVITTSYGEYPVMIY